VVFRSVRVREQVFITIHYRSPIQPLGYLQKTCRGGEPFSVECRHLVDHHLETGDFQGCNIIPQASMGSLYMNSRERAPTARFGRFLLDSHRHELLADGVPVPIGSRAFDVLTVLVEAGGQLVTKDEIASRVWPGRFIEDNCLQFQISALRKALAPDRDFIKTIAGRGYCFIADIATQARSEVVSVPPRGELPTPASFPAATSAGCLDLVAALRLAARAGANEVTPPGVAAQRYALSELTQAWIAQPGQPSETEPVPPTVAAMVQLAEDGSAVADGVRAALATKHLFLLLSIGPAIFGRQDGAAKPMETLPV
jgi:DNA-binding winged helix-turn-helix (wHTH) protein